MWKMQTAQKDVAATAHCQEVQPILAIALIGLTYLGVLFNFTNLYLSFVQTALGVAQWESQPIVHVTRGGSRRTVSVRAWKRSGDEQHWLVAARRDGSS